MITVGDIRKIIESLPDEAIVQVIVSITDEYADVRMETCEVEKVDAYRLLKPTFLRIHCNMDDS